MSKGIDVKKNYNCNQIFSLAYKQYAYTIQWICFIKKGGLNTKRGISSPTSEAKAT